MRYLKRLTALALALALALSLAPLQAQGAGVSNEAAIYAYLRSTMKLNDAAACGVLANIKCESNFNPNAVGDHGTSYGICQWHNSRWDQLKRYRPKDWTTLNGQLEFLRYELVHSKPGVWRYINSVSNDATGAYLAGYYWCYHFEIPRNYPTVSVRRGNLAQSSYWPRYAGRSGGENAPDLVGISAPESVIQGRSADLYGQIYSDTAITSVKVVLLDRNNVQAAAPAEAVPCTKTYSIHTLSRYVGFQKLSPGEYTLEITAANAAGGRTWSQSVTVLPAASATGGNPYGLRNLLRNLLPESISVHGQARISMKVIRAMEVLTTKARAGGT